MLYISFDFSHEHWHHLLFIDSYDIFIVIAIFFTNFISYLPSHKIIIKFALYFPIHIHKILNIKQPKMKALDLKEKQKKTKEVWVLVKNEVVRYMGEKAGQLIEENNENISYFLFLKSKEEIPLIFSVVWKMEEIVMSCELSIEKSNTDIDLLKIANKFNFQQKSTDNKTVFLDDNKILKRISKLSLNLLQQLSETQLSSFISGIFTKELTSFQKILLEIAPNHHQSPKHGKNFKKQTKKVIQMIKKARKVIQKQIGGREKSTIYKNQQKSKIEGLLSVNPKIDGEGDAKQRQKEKENDISIGQLILQQKIEDKNKEKKNKVIEIGNIVKTIQIIEKKIDKHWKCQSSGFGAIMKIHATYKLKNCSVSSLNLSTNQLLSQFEQIKNNTQFYSSLIEKMPRKEKKYCKSSTQSFRTECQILKYLRDKYWPHIATYYLPEQKPDQEISSFYLNYYPKTFQEVVKDDLQKQIKMMKMLAQTLKFMHENKMAHRDLKPMNIMVAKDISIKVIDFGSAWIHATSNPKISSQLRTTIKYNVVYSNNLQNQLMIPRKEYETHEYFDVYAYGKIMEHVFDKAPSKKAYASQGIINMHLDWLSNKCKQENPYNRISQEELVYFLSLIQKLFICCNS